MEAPREWFEKDYYAVLGVASSAADDEITKAYRKLARSLHPDANPGDAAAEERFKEVSAAYDVVGDPEKRGRYDEIRRLGAGGFGTRPGAGAGFSDLGDLFGGLFNRGAGPTGRGVGPQRGADVETEIHLSFEDAAQGVTTTVNVSSDAACGPCRGTGAAPGTSPVACSRCGGRGTLSEDQGFFSLAQPCPSCRGSGELIETPCPECKGTAVSKARRRLKVRIPAGVDDGARIRLKGRGSPGRNGGPPGDLYVKTHVAPHDRFRREGRNLRVSVPVSFADAVLGAKVKVPTLDGAPVTVRVKGGTQPGTTMRVRGRGIDDGKGKGDLLATIDVVVPKNPTAAQRKLIEELAELDDKPVGAGAE